MVKYGILIGLGMVGWMGWASAGELFVEQNGGGDFGTIQAAIDAAVAGDVIIVGDGTWSGDGNRDIDFRGKAVTLRSKNGSGTCIINCGGSTAEHTGFIFQTGEGRDSVVEGFTITNGRHDRAGAIYCSYGNIHDAKASNPTIRRCIIRNNYGEAAGGIYCSSLCGPRIEQCIIAQNFSDQVGGIHFSDECSPEVISCVVCGNEGQFTGGIRTGGAHCNGIIANSVINGNRSYWGTEASGVEWWAYGGSLTLSHCTIVNNAGGPGVLIGGGGDPTGKITNCIVWGNRGNEWKDSQFYFWQMEPSITYCDIEGGWLGEGNIDADPLFVDADGQDDAPGTMDDDLRLIGGSLCLDAGDTSAVPEWMTMDVLGEQRIQNLIVDLGAHEGLNQGLAVMPRDFEVAEGQSAGFTVRLGMDPGETIEVEILIATGDTDISITSPNRLYFDSSNFDQPQTITVTAAQDSDFADGTTVLVVRSPGLISVQVRAVEIDDDSVLYVDGNAVGSGGGADWTNAFPYLQYALAAARNLPGVHEIRVAQGIYLPDQGHIENLGDRTISFELVNGVVLKGGYAGIGASNPDERDIEKYKTILSGDLSGTLEELNDDNFYSKLMDRGTMNYENTMHVVSAIGVDASAVLDGVVITGGTANGWVYGESSEAKNYHGGGVYVESASPTLIDCTITGNIAFVYNGPAAQGGGMYCVNSKPKLIRCSFIRNVADDYDSDAFGAGMSIEDGNPTLIGCTFENNFTYNWGGGIANRGQSHLVLRDCEFTENFGQYGGGGLWDNGTGGMMDGCVFRGNAASLDGGGIYLGYGNSSWTISHCLIYGNKAEWSAGMQIFAAEVQVVNCTIAHNQADDQWGGVMCQDGSTRFLNCIFWGNICDNDRMEWAQIGRDDGKARFDYCCVQGWTGQFAGVGTIEEDPIFADAENGNYYLKSQAGRWDANAKSWVQDDITSPCIDAGNPAAAIMFEPFPNGGVINMGAYGGTAEASKSWFGKPVCETIVVGDLNGDCAVNLADLAMMASHWLEKY